MILLQWFLRVGYITWREKPFAYVPRMSPADKGPCSIWAVTASICLISVLPRAQTQTPSTSFTVDFRAVFDFETSPSAQACQPVSAEEKVKLCFSGGQWSVLPSSELRCLVKGTLPWINTRDGQILRTRTSWKVSPRPSSGRRSVTSPEVRRQRLDGRSLL